MRRGSKSATSVYLTVTPKSDPFDRVFTRKFFNAAEFNEFVKSEDFKARFPETEYRISKEVY